MPYDDDRYEILSESLVQSIRENELQNHKDNDPPPSWAKRRQQMIANLAKFFDMIRYSFQLSKHRLITKEELFDKLTTAHLDIIDGSEFFNFCCSTSLLFSNSFDSIHLFFFFFFFPQEKWKSNLSF